MGCSSSCKIFETFSTSVEWVAQNKYSIRHILHLLDDFLIVAKTQTICHDQLNTFLKLCHFLGIPMAPEKTMGPSQILSFAGIELDTCLMEARLPSDKIAKCKAQLSDFLSRKKVTLKEIQSLTGLLNFACSVVRPGRTFLRRLIDLTLGLRAPHHRIKLNRQVREDLRVWLSFLSEYNCKSFFLADTWLSSDKLHLYTDAAGSLGFGAIFGNHWCYGEWPTEWQNRNITILEFFPIVLSLYLWGDQLSNHCVLFFTDNEALVYVINKQSCKDASLMHFVRKMVAICLRKNILFRAKHIPGVCNRLADSLSRLQVSAFKRMAPQSMDLHPTTIPSCLLPQNWET